MNRPRYGRLERIPTYWGRERLIQINSGVYRGDVEAQNLPEECGAKGNEDVEAPAVGKIAHHQSEHWRTLQHVSKT